MLAGAVAFVLATAAAGRPPSDHYPWGELPLHLALMQNWGLTGALSWNDPAWSISCELAAYLLFPLLVRAVDWRALPSWLVVLAAAAFLLILAAATAHLPTLGHALAIRHQFVIGRLIDHRADIGPGIGRIAKHKQVHRAVEHLDDVIRHVLLHQQQP